MAAEEEAAYVMYRRGGLGLMPIFQYPASDAVRGGIAAKWVWAGWREENMQTRKNSRVHMN